MILPTEMDEYILKRLREDSRHVLERARIEGDIIHPGFKGRLRELLIHDLLLPWLPPYVSCGTGTIIDGTKALDRKHTQDDIIIYDKSLVPPIFASEHAPEGVFLYNGVLIRIEVKSRLNKAELEQFVESCKEVMSLTLAVPKTWVSRPITGTMNMLLAYESDLRGPDADSDYLRVIEAMRQHNLDPGSGAISAVCIPGRGLWKPVVGGKWQKLRLTEAENHLAWFVAVVSNTCFIQHVDRQGRNPALSIDGGIGNYIPADESVWESVG